jgi:hypothetical protein
VKQIDFRVSIKFKGDGSTGFVFEPLTPVEFEKQSKVLYVWQLGMITSLRSAVIAWSKKHDKVNNRTIRKYMRIQKRFMKHLAKAKKQAAQKPVAQPAVQ